jgi:adenylate cyclase class 2
MKSPGNQEVEVKLRIEDPVALRRRMASLKMRPNGRVYERNTLFDTPHGGLAKHGQLLRIRVEGPATRPEAAGSAILTFKGPSELATTAQGQPLSPARGKKRYKIREELEVVVPDPDKLRAILERLGLRRWFRYEKYRTSYHLPASLHWARGLQVELDETPIGTFLELEGPPLAIDRAAKLLGYGLEDYITRSYLALYLDQCRKQGVPAGDMLFPTKKK